MKQKAYNFMGTENFDKALAYIRKHKKGGFDLSETCRASVIRAAKRLGWKPDA